MAWANPVAPTEATAAVDDDQATERVKSCTVPLVNVPVALNCWVVPSGTDALCGVTANATSTAGVTVKVVDPDTEPEEAVIVLWPCPALVARPVLAIDATVASDQAHVTEEVRFCVLPVV